MIKVTKRHQAITFASLYTSAHGVSDVSHMVCSFIILILVESNQLNTDIAIRK